MHPPSSSSSANYQPQFHQKEASLSYNPSHLPQSRDNIHYENFNSFNQKQNLLQNQNYSNYD